VFTILQKNSKSSVLECRLALYKILTENFSLGIRFFLFVFARTVIKIWLVLPVFFYQCHREQASSFGFPSGRPGGKKSINLFVIPILSQCCGPGCLSRNRIFPIPDPGSRIPDPNNKKEDEKNNK
jgi:hypothetical protein